MAEAYRREIEDLIAAQNRDLPICPYDGRPCFQPEIGCSCYIFTEDGKERLVWECPRVGGECGKVIYNSR